MGYALGSFFMLLGFLTSKPDTWETCYKPCYAEKFAANETTAEKLCVDQCVIEDAADGSHFDGQDTNCNILVRMVIVSWHLI